MSRRFLQRFVSTGLSDTMTAALAVGAAAAAGGVGYYLGRRTHAVHAETAEIVKGTTFDAKLVAAPLLAECLGRFIESKGATKKPLFMAEIVKIRREHGVATLNVVLFAVANNAQFDSLVFTADGMVKYAMATIVELADIETTERLPESLLKADDARSAALLTALRECFAAKQFVKPAVTLAVTAS